MQKRRCKANRILKIFYSFLFQLEAHRQLNKIESEQKRREQIIARDPIIQKKIEILKRLQEKQQNQASTDSK